MRQVAEVTITCQRPSAWLSPTKYRWTVHCANRTDRGYASFRWTARRAAAKAARNLAADWDRQTYHLEVNQ